MFRFWAWLVKALKESYLATEEGGCLLGLALAAGWKAMWLKQYLTFDVWYTPHHHHCSKMSIDKRGPAVDSSLCANYWLFINNASVQNTAFVGAWGTKQMLGTSKSDFLFVIKFSDAGVSCNHGKAGEMCGVLSWSRSNNDVASLMRYTPYW